MKQRLSMALLAIAVLSAVLVGLTVASIAAAAPPAPLIKVPGNGSPGTGSGSLQVPEGIAADPDVPGNVYVVDLGNARIGEYTPWGAFVKAWGWGVRDGSAELQSCTEETGCRKGLEGSGDGEFEDPEAVTVDGAGDVYVLEASSHRVQKFDPTGGGVGGEEAVFLAKFGEAGTGPGQFSAGKGEYGNKIAACASSGSVYVGEGDRIQRFDASGVFAEEISLSANVQAVAVDSACHLYVAFQGKAEVEKLEGSAPEKVLQPGLFKPESEAERSKAVAVDGNGNLYVDLVPDGGEPVRVQKYAPSGECLTCSEAGEEGEIEVEAKERVVHRGFDRSPETQLEGVAASSACGSDDVYVAHFKAFPGLAYFSAFGDPPNVSVCARPEVAPEVGSQYALSVEASNAELRAEINPRFWNDTTFHVEYGPASCSGGGCTSTTAPLLLTTKTISTPITTPSVLLEGLKPGITYHYRFVANTCFEHEKVGGVEQCVPGKEVESKGTGSDGVEGLFTTYRSPVGESCPENKSFRTGASAFLPDCRAFEMVSPIDKEGGGITALPEFTTALPAVLDQSAVSGARFAYGSYRSFAGAASAPFTTQYVATREAGRGWVTHGVTSPREQILTIKGNSFDTEFKFFSPDLCQAWIGTFAEPALSPEAPAGYPDLYRRTDEECGGPGYEALNTTEPPHLKGGPPVGVPDVFSPELLGVSADGSTSVFAANDVLAPGGTYGEAQFQLYAARDGEESFICFLPGGHEHKWTGSCTAGSTAGDAANRSADVAGTLSADGSKAFWTASKGSPAPIYVRENPFGEGPECVEEGSPCTIAVSQKAEEEAGTMGSGSQFWAAAKDGSKALFTTGGKLYEFVLGEPTTPHLIAGEVVGTLGSSEDASRVYFVSDEALTPAGEEDPGHQHAEAGQQNLYFHEAGQYHFIGTLSVQDQGGRFSPIASVPHFHTSRVAPDGLSAVFMSSARLTGYDNTDQTSGEADAEVFVYDAGAGKLVCASCNPSGARPQGEEYITPGQPNGPWTAARIPVFENNLYASRVLSDDGARLFFDTTDALVPRDSNGTEDVYEWEAPGVPSAGACTMASSTYSPQDGGCVDLISSGQSKLGSEFLDASPDGSNVFFITLSSLVFQDPGLVDVYDARVGGGLPSPASPPAACEGEACQGPYSPPNDLTPASSVFEGVGNVTQAPLAINQQQKKAVKKPVKKKPVKKKSGKKRKRVAKKGSRARRAGSQRNRGVR